ncbi:hypothetical protein KGF56_000223 [Candida oxycetoniae]|uniref:Uncharacterized protein n=1 Tax=Candida oxycetoniae TaxID=497107 RepID=A0AAI9T231_9ASCO|nr:uncharacterized protein KGF56_000223 [Candida oxycetoniae]KAI3406931.2 hypothetical protein KGF56_000223 [Candida oxycetoniae]
MSELLNRYKESRRDTVTDDYFVTRNNASLYPRLSRLKKNDELLHNHRNSFELKSTRTSPSRGGIGSGDVRNHRGGGIGGGDVRNYRGGGIGGGGGDTSFASRMSRYEELNNKDFSSKYTDKNTASLHLSGSKESRRSRMYDDSPIKTLNESLRKTRPSNVSLNRILGSSDSLINGRYKVSKPTNSKHTNKKNGFISRIFNYLTANDDDDDENDDDDDDDNEYEYVADVAGEYGEEEKQNKGEAKRGFAERGVKFRDGKRSYNKEYDEVDEAIALRKETERQSTIAQLREVQKEHRKLSAQLINEQRENKRLVRERERIEEQLSLRTNHYEKRINMLENELFEKNVELDKSVSQGEVQRKADINRLEREHEETILSLQKEHQKELHRLDEAHQETVRILQQENTELEEKNRELDEKLFNTNFELQQVKKELATQTQRSNAIQVEVSLRDRLRQARLTESEINHYYAKSSRIEHEIAKLADKVHTTPKGKDYAKTASHIEETLASLENIVETLDFEELENIETYYNSAQEFLTTSVSECESLIQGLSTNNNNNTNPKKNYFRLLNEYYSLKRLNELSFKLLYVKELLQECKILKEFSDTDIDIREIYKRVKVESF